MREGASRAAVAASQNRAAVGRHERRPHLVAAPRHDTRPVSRATRAGRSRHGAPTGWALWTERAGQAAAQARTWWAEGTERVAARARERWSEQVAAQRTTTIRPVAAAGTFGDLGHAAGQRAAGGRARRADPTPRHLAGSPPSRRASWREDVMTGWCSLLLVLGLYLDGWNHINLLDDELGPFLTPWHGLLYLGFAVTAGWILTRNQRRGAWSLQAVPPGYRLALVGVGLAMVAVAGDAVWHTIYGEEQGLALLISPFHLVLFTGACLLVGSALRAAWSGPTSAAVPGLRVFWPVVLSTTLVVAMTAFFFQYVSPVVAWRRPGLAGLPAGSPFAETVQVYDLLGLLVHNLLFVAPVLLLLLRWQTPLGTFTVMAGSVALLLATQTELGLVGLVGAAVLGGAAADVSVSLLRPSPQRRWAARAVAVIAPAVYWTTHFALLKAGYGVTWELEIWLGSVVWASLSGLSLALLMWPPAVPLTAWNRGRTAATRSHATPTAMPARMVGR
jgi:hypothetical protein